MNQLIQIDPLDTHSMQLLASSQNAVALVRFQEGHESFTAAHAQTSLAIYVHLTHLAGGRALGGATMDPIPGGNEYSVRSDNPATTASVSALVKTTPTDDAGAQVEADVAETAKQAANDAEAAKVAAQ